MKNVSRSSSTDNLDLIFCPVRPGSLEYTFICLVADSYAVLPQELGYERNADPFWISSFYGCMLAGARRPPRWRKERKQWNNWWYILVVPFYRQHHHSEQTTRWWWWCFKVESQEPQTQSFSQTSISIIFSALSTFLCTILHLLFAVIAAVVAKVCLLAKVIRFFMSSSEAKKSNSRHNHSLLSLCLILRFTFNLTAMAKKSHKDSERD